MEAEVVAAKISVVCSKPKESLSFECTQLKRLQFRYLTPLVQIGSVGPISSF